MFRRIALCACACLASVVSTPLFAIEPPAEEGSPVVTADALQIPPAFLQEAVPEDPFVVEWSPRPWIPAAPQANAQTRHLLRLTLLADDDAAPPRPLHVWEMPVVTPSDRVTRLPDAPVGRLRSVTQPPMQHRPPRMPAFEIVEESLPTPMLLATPAACLQSFPCTSPDALPAVRARYAATAPAITPIAAGTVPPQQPPTPIFGGVQPHIVSADATSASPAPPAYQPSPSFSSGLNLPTPNADPVEMAIELFEKLKASEERVAEARGQLANAQRELAELRAMRHQPEPSEQSEVVMLEVRLLELDLTRLETANIDVPGICREQLSQAGLCALAASGALDRPQATSVGAAGPGGGPCNCVTCTQSPGARAEGPPITETMGPAGAVNPFADAGDQLEKLLSQLEQTGAVSHLSRPRFMIKSGQPAAMMVGQEIPYKQTAATTGPQVAEGVTFCNIGIEMRAKPTVLPDGDVQIELEVKRSTLDETLTGHTGKPAIRRQSVETTVEVPSGKMAVVAGLVHQQQVAKRDTHASPYTAATIRYAAPVSGEDRLFRPVGPAAAPASSAAPHSTGRVELVVLVTPRVIAPARPVADAPAR